MKEPITRRRGSQRTDSTKYIHFYADLSLSLVISTWSGVNEVKVESQPSHAETHHQAREHQEGPPAGPVHNKQGA